MSGGNLLTVIAQMEVWLADPGWEPDPVALAQWNADYSNSVEMAKKSPEWLELQVKAHLVGELLELRLVHFTQVRDELRAELEIQNRGDRALRGYGSVFR